MIRIRKFNESAEESYTIDIEDYFLELTDIGYTLSISETYINDEFETSHFPKKGYINGYNITLVREEDTEYSGDIKSLSNKINILSLYLSCLNKVKSKIGDVYIYSTDIDSLTVLVKNNSSNSIVDDNDDFYNFITQVDRKLDLNLSEGSDYKLEKDIANYTITIKLKADLTRGRFNTADNNVRKLARVTSGRIARHYYLYKFEITSSFKDKVINIKYIKTQHENED